MMKRSFKKRARAFGYGFLVFLFMIGIRQYFYHQYELDRSLVLSQYLEQSQAELVYGNGTVKKARYVGNGRKHIYEGEPSWFEVSKKADQFKDVSDAFIYLHPHQYAIHRIHFRQLPKGRRLKVIFGFSDLVLNDPHGAVGFRCRVGERVLFEEKVATEPGLDYVEYLFREEDFQGDAMKELSFEVWLLDNTEEGWKDFYFNGLVW